MEHKPIDEKFTLWTRNVQDEYKGVPDEEIKSLLKAKANKFAVMMSQLNGDFNFGSVVRSSNFLGASEVFYYGRKKWDKRSSVGVFNYTDVNYLDSFDSIMDLKKRYHFVALENNIERKVQDLSQFSWPENSLIVVGEENAGISKEILDICDSFVEIKAFGSVRSLNAAVATSIAMYDYVSKRGK